MTINKRDNPQIYNTLFQLSRLIPTFKPKNIISPSEYIALSSLIELTKYQAVDCFCTIYRNNRGYVQLHSVIESYQDAIDQKNHLTCLGFDSVVCSTSTLHHFMSRGYAIAII